MDKINNSSSPALLEDIIRARANIKQKYNALKTGRFETESLINNTFSSIIAPLGRIQANTERIPSSPSPSQSQPDVHSIDDRTISSPAPPPPAPSSSPSSSTTYRDLNERFGPWKKNDLDKIYGPKILSNGIFILGNKKIQFFDNALHIEGDTTYPLSPGLIDLIFVKSPTSRKYTQTDLNTYKSILTQTAAHKTIDGSRIRSSTGSKYNDIISKLFTGECNITVGTVINMRLQKNNVIYWQDPNELVDRLRLLYASLVAGNTSVRNEIIAICEELVEARILKKIPNV